MALVLATALAVPAVALAPPAAAAPDFDLSINPQSQTLSAGGSTGFLIGVSVRDGFSDPVTLSLDTDLPDGVTATFSPTVVNPPGTSVLTVTAAADTTIRATFNLTIVATAGALQHSLSRQATVVDFGLVRECTGIIEGTVTEDSSARTPLEGVNLDVSGVQVRTDERGFYRIEGIALGQPGNTPTQPVVRATKDGYWTVDQTAWVTGALSPEGTCVPDTTTVDLTMLPTVPSYVHGYVVEGEVTPPDYDTVTALTTPIEGAQVCLPINVQPLGIRCETTRADGRFPPGVDSELGFVLFDNQASEVSLHADVPGLPERHGYWGTNKGPSYPVGTVQPGDHVQRTIPLVRQCTGAITGRVTDSNGGSAANVRVSAVIGGWDGDTVTTAADGSFSIPELLLGFNNRPIDYDVFAGNSPGGVTARLGPCGSPPTHVDLTITSTSTGAVTGFVKDEETPHNPIEGATVGQAGNATGGDQLSCSPKCVETDAEGHYLLDGVEVGARGVTAAHPDFWAPLLSVPVDVTTGAPVPAADILLLRRHYAGIAGTVTDAASGEPIEGAAVADSFSNNPSDQTNERGEYALNGVQLNYRNAPRTVPLRAMAAGYWERRVDVDVTQDNTTLQDISLIKICPGATITGTVVDANTKEALQGAIVSGGGHAATTDGLGHYDLGPVTVGTDNSPREVFVTADAEGYAPQTQSVTVTCGATIRLDFGNPFATLVVTKRTVGGTGSFAFTSTGGLPSPADQAGGFTLSTAAANADQLTFVDLPAGRTYTVAEAPDSAWALTGLSCSREGASILRFGTGSTFAHTGWQAGDNAAQVSVAGGDTITCTFTNTQQHTGFLELAKKFVAAPASATVNLLVTSAGGAPGDIGAAIGVGDGGSTGRLTVPSGTYTLTETAGVGTSLTGYSSALRCVLRGTTTQVPVTDTVQVAANADVMCTFTNTRQAPKTGAKTIGYWQNKNGQTILTRAAATNGVCNVGTWLRGYAPFADLSADATCAQVGGYVFTLVKAAKAKGASMNAMLKAQMAATALSTYFSDPGLGGNKIAAPSPVGGRVVDLRMVCRMIDSSTGTATCNGTYRDASSAFDGAPTLTVNQMLAYAASQSNAGGSIWFGNIRARQELAKDAFDATNNEAALAP